MTSPFAALAAAATLTLASGALLVTSPPAAGSPGMVERSIASAATRPATLTYAPPLGAPLTVAHAFEAPPAPWEAGHRGVDLLAPDGAPVLAPADGVVTFAGLVAGRSVVVVSHPDGRRSSLEPVAGSVPVGSPVTRGQAVGTLAGTPTHCEPMRCLHWGVREGETYLNPMSLLPPRGPVVLLPLDD